MAAHDRFRLPLEILLPDDRLRMRQPLLGIWLILAILGCCSLPAVAQTIDTTLWATDGAVGAVVQSGDTIYIGGSFSRVGPATGGGVLLSGATAAVIQPLRRVAGQVHVAVPDGSGGWFLGGRFAAVGGLARHNLAHVLADGSVADWDPGADDDVLTLALSGNTLYVGGYFYAIGGVDRRNFAAVDATTGQVTGWDPGADSYVFGLVVDRGIVYAAGNFRSMGGRLRTYLAAVDSATGATTNWNPAPNGGVNAMVMNNGILYAGGYFTQMGGLTRNYVAAVDPATGEVTEWDPDADLPVSHLAAGGGTIYLCGQFGTVGGLPRVTAAAVDATTGIPTAWNVSVVDPYRGVYDMAVDGGVVYLAGRFDTLNSQPRTCLAAVDAVTGALTGWNPDILGLEGLSLAVKNGVVFAGGEFWMMKGVARRCLAALDATTGRPTDEYRGQRSRAERRHDLRGGVLHQRGRPGAPSPRRRGCDHGCRDGLEPEPRSARVRDAAQRKHGLHRRTLHDGLRAAPSLSRRRGRHDRHRDAVEPEPGQRCSCPGIASKHLVCIGRLPLVGVSQRSMSRRVGSPHGDHTLSGPSMPLSPTTMSSTSVGGSRTSMGSVVEPWPQSTLIPAR